MKHISRANLVFAHENPLIAGQRFGTQHYQTSALNNKITGELNGRLENESPSPPTYPSTAIFRKLGLKFGNQLQFKRDLE
jgi:hypothetical protein